MKIKYLFIPLILCILCCKINKNQKNNLHEIDYIKDNDLHWKLKNQTTEFMIKYFKYGLLTNVHTNKLDNESIVRYKSLFYDNAKIYNDLENIDEQITIDKYCSILTDYCLDKNIEIYFEEKITNDYINQKLSRDIRDINPELDSSYRLVIPVVKWTNQFFSNEKKQFIQYDLPQKISYLMTVYNNPTNHEVNIINIEKN